MMASVGMRFVERPAPPPARERADRRVPHAPTAPRSSIPPGEAAQLLRGLTMALTHPQPRRGAAAAEARRASCSCTARGPADAGPPPPPAPPPLREAPRPGGAVPGRAGHRRAAPAHPERQHHRQGRAGGRRRLHQARGRGHAPRHPRAGRVRGDRGVLRFQGRHGLRARPPGQPLPPGHRLLGSRGRGVRRAVAHHAHHQRRPAGADARGDDLHDGDRGARSRSSSASSSPCGRTRGCR